MCGIAGLCSLNAPSRIDQQVLENMISAVHHRGPDEFGLYMDDQAGMAHARLSIIDLSTGSQPIHNQDKSLWIVFNGEIFNYIELREELKGKGHHFHTTSDTEVLLYMYQEYGSECLEKLNGQFGLAIWDNRNNTLFLARDRVGIRPLHYTIHQGQFFFASEIKSLLTLPEIKKKISAHSLSQIFTFWTTLPGQTAFEDIYELPPGHYMTVNNGEVNIRSYWTFPYIPPSQRKNIAFDDAVGQLDELLTDAIRIRLRADVPVGCYLSGGLDSSGITSKVVNNFNNDVQSFGIRFEEDAFDEGTHQQKMVSHLGVKHTEITATNKSISQAFSDVIRHTEKPILRTSPIPLYLLSRKVTTDAGLKVVLTGEGADEVFGGYNIFREAKVRRFWSRQPESLQRPELLSHLYPYIFKNPRLKHTLQKFFAQGIDAPENPFFSHAIRWTNTSKTKLFFSDELKESIGNYDPLEELQDFIPDDFSNRDTLSKAQYWEISLFLSNYLLSSQGDRMAMANSLEIRLPYLDHRVIELAAHFPARWKVSGLKEKYILKHLFRNELPPEITNRPKHPYRAPISQSLLQADSNATNELLSVKAINEFGLFDSYRVCKLLQKIQNSPNVGEIDDMALVAILSTQWLYYWYITNLDSRDVKKVDFSVYIDNRTTK